MENLAIRIESLFKVRIAVFGFDTGEGLPAHSDYRDLPYVWRKSFYKMNVPAVQTRLRRARLILGDVKDTVPNFLKLGDFAPIAFVAFDLDYYSSAREAFRIFEAADKHCLPTSMTSRALISSTSARMLANCSRSRNSMRMLREITGSARFTAGSEAYLSSQGGPIRCGLAIGLITPGITNI